MNRRIDAKLIFDKVDGIILLNTFECGNRSIASVYSILKYTHNGETYTITIDLRDQEIYIEGKELYDVRSIATSLKYAFDDLPATLTRI